jgi:hypothetical protein
VAVATGALRGLASGENYLALVRLPPRSPKPGQARALDQPARHLPMGERTQPALRPRTKARTGVGRRRGFLWARAAVYVDPGLATRRPRLRTWISNASTTRLVPSRRRRYSVFAVELVNC